MSTFLICSGAKPFGYGFAERKVLSAVKLKLGLDQMKLGFTGAAPITKETLEFFGAVGININEVRSRPFLTEKRPCFH